jgi:hypothetical protein
MVRLDSSYLCYTDDTCRKWFEDPFLIFRMFGNIHG